MQLLCLQVTPHNLKKLKALVLNGGMKHPGANFYIKRNTKMKRYYFLLFIVFFINFIPVFSKLKHFCFFFSDLNYANRRRIADTLKVCITIKFTA